jgi:uncharacterized membrane protein YgcG
MNNLYEALEICLQDLEQGVEIETVLFGYPELADELRPILEASVNAKSMAVLDPSAEGVRRNRAKFLQHAAEMREAKSQPASHHTWFASLRRVAVTLVVVAILFASGTGVVRAASTTVPGDDLYPVKRTWEDVLLLFTLNGQRRAALEVEHENERLEELNELFAEGRSEQVDFSGRVTLQNGNEWRVAGFPVVISAQTEMPDQPVGVGSAIRVIGVTGADGIVQAERVKLLPAGAKLPDVEDEPEIEQESNEGPNQQNEDNSGPGAEDDSQAVEKTTTPEIESENSGNGSNSGSGSDSNTNDNTGNENSSSDNSGSDDSNNDSGSNDSNGNDHNSGSDNSIEDNSNAGGNSGSSGDGGGGGRIDEIFLRRFFLRKKS